MSASAATRNHGLDVFLRIGTYDETSQWRRSLARTHYLKGLAPLADYAFFAQRASPAERARSGDIVLLPDSLLRTCSSKWCRTGLTMALGLRFATENSTRAYILSVDDDGFLCTPRLPALVQPLPTTGVVAGTWHAHGGNRTPTPDQHFLLLSRDVARDVAARYLRTHERVHAQSQTLTMAEREYLNRQPHRLDLRQTALHPAHNALALWYQQPSAGAAASFCARHVWVHFCCGLGSANASWYALAWHALQRSADRIHDRQPPPAASRQPARHVPWQRLAATAPAPIHCAEVRARSCTACSASMPQLGGSTGCSPSAQV